MAETKSLDLFWSKEKITDILGVQWIDYRPVSPLGQGCCVEFHVPLALLIAACDGDMSVSPAPSLSKISAFFTGGPFSSSELGLFLDLELDSSGLDVR